MNEMETRISNYIDKLNAEREPKDYPRDANFPELEKLMATVRLVRTLREPALPAPGYPQKLAKNISNRIAKNNMKKTIANRVRSKWVLPPVAALAAGLLFFIALSSWTGLFNGDLVYAMGKAVAQLSNYHGILETRIKNEAGNEWLVRKFEIWSEGDKYAVRQDDGTLTVNNGDKKWQVQPHREEVAVLPLMPDPVKTSFDLRDEANRAKQYPHIVAGTEMIAGRQATKLEISPPGGLAYYLWIDIETNLPIQLQTAMQNALQTTYTFTSLKPNSQLDSDIFTYRIPEGYKVIENDPGQVVATVQEATAISGLIPLVPNEAPNRILVFKDRIVLDYGDTTIIEAAVQGAFKPKITSALGTAAGGLLEVCEEGLRWRQKGLEIQAQGGRRVELARQIATDLAMPDNGNNLVNPIIKVPVDMEIIKADQQQVDRGSSPWQLDPLQVAFTFVNLKVTPNGIQGEPLIPFSNFKLAANNGDQSVIDVAQGPIKKVYLERLIRKDETGIWSVVGYDPR